MLAPVRYFIHKLFWKSVSYTSCSGLFFVFCCFFLWLIPAEWGRFLVRLRAGAILRHGLLSI